MSVAETTLSHAVFLPLKVTSAMYVSMLEKIIKVELPTVASHDVDVVDPWEEIAS